VVYRCSSKTDARSRWIADNSVGAEQQRPASQLSIRLHGSFGRSLLKMSRTAGQRHKLILTEIATTQ